MFGCRKTRTRRVKPGDIVHLGLSEGAESLNGRLREMEEAKLYEYTPSRPKPIAMAAKEEDRHRLVSLPPPERTKIHRPNYSRVAGTERNDPDTWSSLSDARSSLSAPSIYSQMTGVPRHAPEPRVPVKRDGLASVAGDCIHGWRGQGASSSVRCWSRCWSLTCKILYKPCYPSIVNCWSHFL